MGSERIRKGSVILNAAELKTIRESLGLTSQWLADQVGVRLRTVQYWESGRNSVPQDVEELLQNIDASINQSVSETLKLVSEKEANDLVLIRYKNDEDLWHYRPDMKPLPATCHASMLSRILLKLKEKNIECSICYMEPNEYNKWLGGRKDTEQNRAEWAQTPNTTTKRDRQ
ncbi:MAG: DUF1870 family protein [Gammaproteobacteria bacterium]|nr:DUF1870 family protein [Gammaproteobacteria bacterium]